MSSNMAFSFQLFIFFSFLLVSFSNAQRSFRPHGLVLPVEKDPSTLQYVTKIQQRTPLVPLNLVVHLGGEYLLVDCEKDYVSSTYRPVRCRSAQCLLTKSNSCGDCFNRPKPGCNNNTCVVFPNNPFNFTTTSGELAEDVVSVDSTDGSNPGPPVTVPRFIFSCAPTFLLEGLARGSTGLAGLGRARVALPSQFASAFSFHRKFAICLSSNGVIFFGDGPYNFLPNLDASQILTYTPLLINPVSTAGSYLNVPSVEYFIDIKSIQISNKVVPINTTLLTIDSQGNGGTKISTVNPYTTMETSIFKAFTEAFIREAATGNITRVSGVAPFEICFSSKNIHPTRVGPSVPWINLVLRGQNAVWTLTGANSMVPVSDSVFCLGFLEGGTDYPRTSIVIGGYQLEQQLLQFDLATSRLGFSPILFGSRTTCSNFNFTSRT